LNILASGHCFDVTSIFAIAGIGDFFLHNKKYAIFRDTILVRQYHRPRVSWELLVLTEMVGYKLRIIV
jgi:hypothetical protein